MHANTPIFTGGLILSLAVKTPVTKSVLVVTTSLVMAQAVKDFLSKLDEKLTPVWLTSIDQACTRLEWDQPKMVILDNADKNPESAVAALQHISPSVELLFLGGAQAQP
jgi:CheY-like chemotaxis protein